MMHSAELITFAHLWTASRHTDALAPVECDIVSSRVPRNLPCARGFVVEKRASQPQCWWTGASSARANVAVIWPAAITRPLSRRSLDGRYLSQRPTDERTTCKECKREVGRAKANVRRVMRFVRSELVADGYGIFDLEWGRARRLSWVRRAQTRLLSWHAISLSR